MKVVSFKVCPFVERVTALLEFKRVPYEVEYIDLSDKPKWFLKVSPNGQVPILVLDDDAVLFESEAIAEYIDETLGTPVSSLNPVERARDRAWSWLASRNYMVQCTAQRSPDEASLARGRADLGIAFGKIENELGSGPFFHGESFGMVDVAWLTILHRASIIERYAGFDFLDGFPKVKNWQEALMSTGLAEKAVSEDFEACFTAFYLSGASYLGQLTKERCGEVCDGTSECCVEDMDSCA